MKKRFELPVWAGCLMLIVLTLVGTLQYWLPITAETGSQSTRALLKASASSTQISLDFGDAYRYRIPRSAATEGLLEDEAIGKQYLITAIRHNRRGSRDYNEVVALHCLDGKVYLTIQESETARLAKLPGRIALFTALDAGGCALLIWADRRKKKNLQAIEAMPDESEEEEEELP